MGLLSRLHPCWQPHCLFSKKEKAEKQTNQKHTRLRNQLVYISLKNKDKNNYSKTNKDVLR